MTFSSLSTNIFRISLTAERLKFLRNPTEAKAAREHWKIGSMIKENTGSYPENLPVATELKNLQKRLKVTQKRLNRAVKEIASKDARMTIVKPSK